MRRLTASDRKSLIKLASSLEKGSDERRAILSGLKRASSMHVNDEFDIFKARDGNWYGQALAWEVAGGYYDEDEDDDWDADGELVADGPIYGPFDSEDATYKFLRDRYANRAANVDKSGRRPTPKKPVSPYGRRW